MSNSSDVTIRTVKSRKQLLSFIKLPFSLYAKSSCWVPPLIADQLKYLSPATNPYFDHSEVRLLLAEREGKVVGRMSVHTNKQHNLFHDDNVGFFGFYESINDISVTKKLFENGIKWLKERGCDVMRGPLNFSTNDECGLLVAGYESPPFIMMTHNHPYYENLFEGVGLKKSKDLYAYYMKDDKIPERLERLASIIQRKEGVKVRSLAKDKKGLRQDLETIFTLYRQAWELNWGFVPLTNKEFKHLVDTLLPIVDPELVLLAYLHDEPVGFSVALPDYNVILKKMGGRLLPFGIFKALYYKNKVSRLRVLVMGVIKEYQKRGIDGLFYYYTFKNGLRKGYNEAEFSWILEDNVEMNNVAKKLGSSVHKTYRIYDKQI